MLRELASKLDDPTSVQMAMLVNIMWGRPKQYRSKQAPGESGQ